MQIPAFVIAAVIPLLALYIIYRLDLYKTGEPRAIWMCLMAGVVAFWTASLINRTTISQGWLARMDVVRYSAPMIEEILKGLLLWYLVSRPKFTYFVEGAVYGFAAGMGFAIFENFQYIASAGGAGFAVAASRVISTNLIHATTCGILGIALGAARFKRSFGKIQISIAGLLVAILLHVGFNNLVTRVNSGLLLVYAASCGLAGAGLIALLIQRGLKEEKIWIEEKLGMLDRVTSGEAAIVQRLEKVHELLKPLAERFGNKKAAQIEHFLIIQARMGILRKSLDKLSDERMKRSVEDQINRLRAEMDEARRQVGSYAMLYLRHTIPENASPLWGRLEALIQERAAAPRPTGGGMNVWETLKLRQEEQKAMAPESKQESKS
jgi:RsiW-degrading membrane proteinase PrsW (M82 family)